jgi:uncharacterized membrane protein YkoI
MKTKSKAAIAAVVIVALAAGGAGIASATGAGEGPDSAITGKALDQASAAALAEVGGTVTGTEVGDEESYYEVEVTAADGSQTDVQLDRDFNVVGQKADSESPADTSG